MTTTTPKWPTRSEWMKARRAGNDQVECGQHASAAQRTYAWFLQPIIAIFPDAQITAAHGTNSVYLHIPGYARELRISDHTKYGRNCPTDVQLNKGYDENIARIDRALRAVLSDASSYAQVKDWTEI